MQRTHEAVGCPLGGLIIFRFPLRYCEVILQLEEVDKCVGIGLLAHPLIFCEVANLMQVCLTCLGI